MGPGPAITLRQFLRRVVDGELSYIWDIPHTRASLISSTPAALVRRKVRSGVAHAHAS